MNIVVCVDSFKGSLSSMEAGNAIKEGIKKSVDANVDVYPLSDGGEGFVESYMYHKEGVYRNIIVKDAMMKDIKCKYAIIPNTHTAVMEMASMCGIQRINKLKKDVLYATTYGLGQMIIDALDEGCKNFIIGIGGSGTNDAGSGAMMALGYELYDDKNQQIPLGAYGLSKIHHIEDRHVDSRLKNCTFYIACDVKNPLTGINGCSAIFGPQKGADTEMVQQMDTWLKHYADVVSKYDAHSDSMMQGSGAAGGLGFSFVSFLNATLVSGIDVILEHQQMEKAIKQSDLVITGEGCLDVQTVMGKAPAGIARLAKKYQKPVIAFAGSLSEDADLCNLNGIDAYFCIQRHPCSLKEAMDVTNTYQNLSETSQQVFRLYGLK